ncbi:MAG: hypothetical protein BYD32DRAFT_484002 [Podila humilis]|nr:MAG: hypothetical protein BYD32DRAFT_484002 [Podila humilis]
MDLLHTLVDDLKKRVKEVKSPMFDHIPADELQLFKVAILEDPEKELEPIELKYLSSHSRLLHGQTSKIAWTQQLHSNDAHAPVLDVQCRANAFSVKINFADNNVDDLKKLIKQAKTPLWDYLAADELTLSRVSIPDDPNKQREMILLRDVIFQKELRATESMVKAFG